MCFHNYRNDHPNVPPSNVSQVVTDLPEEGNEYEYICMNIFDNGRIAYSGCSAYGVHLEDQGNVSGNKVNMDENGTDEQVVSSAHEMENTECKSGDGENEGNEDESQNENYYY